MRGCTNRAPNGNDRLWMHVKVDSCNNNWKVSGTAIINSSLVKVFDMVEMQVSAVMIC